MLIADFYDQLSCRVSAGQVGVGLLHTFCSERVLVEDVDLHDTLAHDVKEELGVVRSFLGSGQIVHHGRTDELHVFLCEFEERKRRDHSRSVSERDERSFPFKELEVLVEPRCRKSARLPWSETSWKRNGRVLAYAVKHRIHSNTVRELQRPAHSVLLFIQYDVIRSMFLCELRFLFCRRRTDHRCALPFGILSGDKPESSGNGVDEDGVALLDFVRFFHERKNGAALQEPCSTGSGADARFGRDREDFVPRDGDVLCVRALGELRR